MKTIIYSKECHLSHENMVKFSKLGILNLGINNANAVDISSNKNLKPTKTTASSAFLFWSWFGFAILGYSIYLSITSQWWYFIVGIFLWQLVWKANKKSNSQNLLDAAIVDQHFYEKILNLNGWIYECHEEKVPQIKQSSVEAIALANSIKNTELQDLNTSECLNLFNASGFKVLRDSNPIEIEYFDSVIEYDDFGVKKVAKNILAIKIINQVVVSSGYELMALD